jgi:hypothetical protein
MNKLLQIIFLNLLWTICACGAIYALASAGYLPSSVKTEILLILGFPLQAFGYFIAVFTFSLLFVLWYLCRNKRKK